MQEKRFVLTDPMGLHARPAAQLMMALKDVASFVTISGNGQTVDGKDVIAILSLGCLAGDEITFQAEGPDEEAAMELICRVMAQIEQPG